MATKTGRPRGRPKKTAKHDPGFIAKRMRAGFMDAIEEVCSREDKHLHEVMADWLQKDPKGTIGMMSMFFPKDSQVDIGGNLAGYLMQLQKDQQRNQPKSVIGETIENNERVPPPQLAQEDKPVKGNASKNGNDLGGGGSQTRVLERTRIDDGTNDDE